ncbi:MAG: LysM peptidoglycan-binding domain-containing protein [Ilumatobacteraceae bacterium]
MTHSLYHSSVSPFPSMARPAVRPNYLARRTLVAALMLATLILAVAVFVLLAGLGGRPASASQAEPAITQTSGIHVAAAGDSLWSIAESYRGDVGIDRYVDALISLNGGTAVQIGQAVHLP